jgi:hypothetical protein
MRRGLLDMVESPHISDEEQEVLGWQTTCRLYRIRENHRGGGKCKHCKRKGTSLNKSAVVLDIEQAFREELAEMEE